MILRVRYGSPKLVVFEVVSIEMPPKILKSYVIWQTKQRLYQLNASAEKDNEKKNPTCCTDNPG